MEEIEFLLLWVEGGFYESHRRESEMLCECGVKIQLQRKSLPADQPLCQPLECIESSVQILKVLFEGIHTAALVRQLSCLTIFLGVIA